MKRVVITINRQYGSGGKTIGYMLAEKLEFHATAEILQRASEESGINESMFNARDERLKRLPKFIKKYAAEGSCVLIGRCADFVLKDDPDMISVYVHADHDFQMKSALERVSMSEKEMEKYIERTNKYRSDFYHYHTGRSWDDAENYDLCINSGKLGFEKTVELIESYIKIK